MTKDQWMGLLRLFVGFAGGALVTKGYLTQKDVTAILDSFSQLVDIGTKAAAPVATLVGIWLSLKANSKTSILTSAATMPEVEKIKLVPTQDAKALEEVTPPNVKVSA